MSSTHSIIGQAITGKPGTNQCSPTLKPGIRLNGFGTICAPCGNSPIFRRCRFSGAAMSAAALPSRAISIVRSVISRSASGCSASGTPSAAAAAWRVWSSGVAPMPPQENTTSRPESVSRSVATSRSRSSPR